MNKLIGFNRAVFVAFLVIVSFCNLATAIELPVRVDRITIENGLSQSTVYSMMQSADGNLWVATGGGISVYDGYKILRIENIAGDDNSLSDNYVRALVKASDDTIWIGTDGGGLNRYFPKTKTFKRYALNAANDVTDVYALAEDTNKRIWIGTNKGAFRLDSQSEEFEKFSADRTTANRKIIGGTIRAIAVNRNGLIWLGSNSSGISVYDPIKDEIKNYTSGKSGLSDDAINVVQQTKDGTIWVGTEFGGLNRLITDDRFEAVGSKDLSSIGDTEVTSILEDPSGLLWLGTWSNGIVLYDRHTNQFRRLNKSLVNRNSLSSDTVISLFQDNFGSVWAGTFDNGLNKISVNGDIFKHYVYDPLSKNSPIDSTVWSFAEDRNGLIWIGTKKGLSRLSPSTGGFENFNTENSILSDIGSNDVRALAVRGDDLWIGTYDGLKRYNLKSGAGEIYKVEVAGVSSLTNNKVRLLLFDKNGMLWIGTQNGLNQLNPTTDQIRQFNFKEASKGGLPHPRIRGLALDPLGNVVVGTSGGLAVYDETSDKFTTINIDNSGLADNDIRAIYFDELNRMWVGTQKGISIFDAKSNRWTNIRQQNGLANDTIYNFIEDGDGLWVTTNNGLSRINRHTLSIQNFHYEDGLQSNEFNFNAALKSSIGKIYIGGINGFNSFDPALIVRNNTLPRVDVALSSIDINGDRQLPLPDNPSFVVSSGSGFTANIKALHFANPTLNRVEYRLLGLERDWNITNEPFASVNYAGLSQPFMEKNFTLEARAVSSSGVKSAISQYKITALPPIWSQPNLVILYVAIGLIILTAIVLTGLNNIILEKRIITERSQAETIISDQQRAIEEQASQLNELIKFKQQSDQYNSLRETDRSFLDMLEKITSERLSDSGFGVAELAQVLNVSEQTLRRRLVSLIKCTPQDYIAGSKILEAQRLLSEGHLVKETAFAVGFIDQAHFSRVFKRVTNQTPTEFSKDLT